MASAVTADLVPSHETSTFDQGLAFETVIFFASTVQNELAIFAIAIFISLAFRNISPKKKNKCSKLDIAERKPTKISFVPVRPQRVAGSPRTEQPASAGAGEGCPPALKQTASAIDMIVNLMHGQPSLKSLNRGLEIYKKLRSDSQEKFIAEASKHSMHSADKLYAVMIQVVSRLGHMDMVDTIMADMSQQGIRGSVDLYENAMKLLASQKQYRLALKVYDRLAATGLEPSGVTWSCLVGFATEVGELHRAVSFFESLSSVVTPSIRAYMTILRVHGKRKDWFASLAIFKEMQNRGVAIDSPVLNLVLATGIAVDKIEAAEKLLAEAETMTPPLPDTVSYNTIVKGYAHRNDAEKAFKTVRRMQERGLPFTLITFNTALDAAFRASKPTVALEILSIMKQSRLQPDKFTCTILIKGLSKCPTRGLIENCLDILLDANCNLDGSLRSRLYQCLLEASRHVSATSLLKRAFTQMRQQGVTLSGHSYRMLLQEIGQAGVM